MLYLSQMMGKPVVDATGEKIGTISDLAISTGEVFPRITSLAFQGPGKVPFMISWRKYVEEFDEDGIRLSVPAHDIRFSYLQPEEILLARDLLNRQIVDTQGMKVVRVNDLKLSISGTQLRLLGAEVGARGILRGLAPWLERAVVAVAKVFGRRIDEQIIAWNYMDLLDRDLSEVQLSVTHKRLDELHPADVADILEQLDPQQRANVFQHLDDAQATEAISEMEDEYQADFIEDLDDARAAGLLGSMDPDDAADIVRDLSYEKAETLLRLMGVEDATEIRRLLGYKDGTAGGMMTTQFVSVHATDTVGEVIEVLRELPEDHPTVHYVYVLDEYDEFEGVLQPAHPRAHRRRQARGRRHVRGRDLRAARRDGGGRGGRHLQVRAARHARGGRAQHAAGHRHRRRRLGCHRGGRERRQDEGHGPQGRGHRAGLPAVPGAVHAGAAAGHRLHREVRP